MAKAKWELVYLNECNPYLERKSKDRGFASIEILDKDLFIDHEIPVYGMVCIAVPVEMVKKLLKAHKNRKRG